MLGVPDLTVSENRAPMYARFSRRLRAVLLDALVIASIFYIGALVVHSLAVSDGMRPIFWGVVVLCILLYEPLLVAMTGGTLGHRFTNLRVVDNQTNGNVRFPKALARAIIKDLLGWFSFVTMTVARRHQALHDIFTKSTVQVRDVSKAQAHHFAAERPVDNLPGLPSRFRRIMVITIYVALAYLVLSIASIPFFSTACLNNSRCVGSDAAVSFIVGGVWLALGVLFVTLGWKGRLFGCRKDTKVVAL
jgi:uncharacterized RDD family membrane protein YckC